MAVRTEFKADTPTAAVQYSDQPDVEMGGVL